MYTTQCDIFTSVLYAEVNMPLRSYIEAIDRRTILYNMVSAQQTNLYPENTSQSEAIFGPKVCLR